jgi:BirA family biotin operon repressor/biotin-[acetyl-CoA-carboxylase] ligase
MSVLLIDSRLFRLQEALTVAAGLAVAEGIENITGLRAELKWPNDVLLGGRKVAGVLVECRRVSGKDAIVIGMGINVGVSPPAGLVDAPATCLADSFDESPDRAAVLCEVLSRLDEWISAVVGEDIEPLHEAWVSRCGMLGQRVAVEYGGRRIVGRVLDVSPLDGLVLVDDRGTNLHLPAAGTTILPCNTDE